ncbi:MAG: DUF4276 family protein [Flavobacteriales bacterium]|nr:DUF4276 family protein [Flavobacteriales bacterium]
MKIGLVGEAPSDTKAMKNLLNKRFSHFTFETLIEDIRGSELDNQKTKHLLRASYIVKRPDYVIFIRDLDSLETDRKKILERNEYFNNSKSIVNNKALFLLHIFEIEALILTDIETFNKKYSCAINEVEDVMKVVDPKKLLKENSSYKEGDLPDLFDKICFDKTLNCAYFKTFVNKLDKL